MAFDTISQPTIQRFRTGIEYQKELLALTRNIQQRMLNNLASNYPKDQNTNIAEFFKSIAKEFARLQISSSDVNEYKFHSECKEEYLFQILGDSLFLSERAINEDLDDISYKNFLIRVRNAFFEGSKKENIQSAVSDILGIPVELKEVYLRLRYNDTGYSLKDTHKMFFDIFVDNNNPSIGIILESIKFFVDLIKPAHVIYDTRLVYTEEIKNNKKCKYSYITQNLDYEVYGTTYIYIITYKGSKIYKYSGTDPSESWRSGVISSIDKESGIIYLSDNTKIVYDNNTLFYIRTSEEDIRTDINSFEVGDEIKYYAIKDSSDNSTIIDDTWLYTGIISDIHFDEEIVILSDGNIIVFNNNTLVYTRDGKGEFRVNLDKLSINDEIIFKAEKHTRSFQFYVTPKEAQDNYYKQFDPSIINKPFYQGVVKKNKDIPEELEEGYNIVVEDDIATIKNIKTRFYKIDNAKIYSEKEIYKYSLFVDNSFVYQFQLIDDRPYTIEEAKNIFIQLGYTILTDPNTKYKITITKTGILAEDNENPTIKNVDNDISFCDQDASCILKNLYEDKRKYYPWPNVELCSGFFVISHEFEIEPPIENGLNIQGWFRLSSDPNYYTVPKLPILNEQGEIANKSDVKVYLNGLLIEGAIEYIDPWEGIIGLNFLPPFNSILRIDYYFSERYPTLVTQLNYTKSIESDDEENLPALLNVLNIQGNTSRLTWPFKVDSSLYGDELDYQMNKFPILNKKGELATPSDITLEIGNIIVSGKLKIIQVEDGQSLLQSVDKSWEDVLTNDFILIELADYLTNHYLYPINSINYFLNQCTIPFSLILSDKEYSYTIVRFNKIENGVERVRPLLGHIRINFIPPLNSILKFNYYYTYQQRNYLLVSDEVDRTSDTFYNYNNKYSLIGDQSCSYKDKYFWDFNNLLKKGYRYRAFNLFNSSILNSETLITDNKYSLVDRYSLTFSGEYLKDKDKNIKLNDIYLKKNIEPETILNPDIPLFIETYTDNCNYNNELKAYEEDSYEEDVQNGQDLKGSFNIIEPDNSGLIDYNSVCDVKEKQRINLYSDLKIVSTDNNGKKVDLSSIEEDISSFPFKFIYVEPYYPDREQRLNDYLDYINQVPTQISTGKIYVLNGSSIVKSKNVDFRFLNVGDTLVLKNVPVEEYINGEWVTRYKDINCVLLEIIDKETVRISQPYKGVSGEFSYILIRNRTIAIDIGLAGGYVESNVLYGNINRQLFINNSIGFNYGFSEEFASSFPPGVGINFPDPDPDPIPANPDNPYINNPEVSYYSIEPYIIDGKEYITNRLLGITGIVPTSNIIDGEGRSYGYTGLLSGVTGPSGALDLGITGPVGYANPFEIEGFDIYTVPSGYTGSHFSYSEAEYRVQWRNFDQNLVIVTPTKNGIFIEYLVNQLDDQIVDNILLSFWIVNTQTMLDLKFSGTVFITSKLELSNVLASSFPEGRIFLTPTMRVNIKNSLNPSIEYPEYKLNDTRYNLYRMIIREILSDGLIKTTEIQQFIPI